MGTVGHWGHVHTRKNYYDALITIDAVEDNWRITGLELIEEKRVDPYTTDSARESGPVAGPQNIRPTRK
jgi:hypothetical protein